MKARLAWLLVPLALLWGCQNETAQGTATAASLAEAPAYTEQYVLSPQVSDDRRLQEPGQQVRDVKGGLELLAANMEPQTMQIGDIELTIHETKLLHYTPDYSLIDFYHSYTHDQEFELAKFFVEINNGASEKVNFAPVALIETESGEVKTWEDDVYLESLNEGLKPGEVKSGNVGFIVKGGAQEIKLTTSKLFAADGELLAPAQTITIKLN
ncbi:DUF4352 domain-containing protein [Planococcus alpniumensis]|uniref:DUF4352 domain-containing protein n=1 Tax=Planococcus alpniumensis TaxID=2708345 RepID=UPI001B8CC4B5|nr:hypothetical protein [Planococcus sp. MSAK28401]